MYPLKFTPKTFKKLWGHEDWLVSPLPNNDSVVSNGPLAGRSLKRLTAEFGSSLLGRNGKQQGFPLLVKKISADQHLSVQVHPANNNSRVGKSECWYILSRQRQNPLFLGISPHHNWKEKLMENPSEILHTLSVEPGQLIYIPAGTIHALPAGATVLEFQQPTDCTYRIYDWRRLDSKGLPRPIQPAKALAVVNPSLRPIPLPPVDITANNPLCVRKILLYCAYFIIEEWAAKGPIRLNHPGDTFILLYPLDNHLKVIYRHKAYWCNKEEIMLIPAEITSAWLSIKGKVLTAMAPLI